MITTFGVRTSEVLLYTYE